jgi:multiple sugar transport system permease protein
MKKRKLGEVAGINILLIYTLITMIPLIWLFITSFKNQIDMFTYPPSFIFAPTLEHYRTVLQESSFLSYLSNSIYTALISGGLSVIVGSMAAYGSVRAKSKHVDKFMFSVLLLRIIPPIAIIVPLFMMLRTVRLYDSVLGLALVYLSFNMPTSIWLMRTYFNDIPVSVEESAMIDGCNRFQILWKIVFPMAAPGLVATAIINLIFSWNEFPLALMLTARVAKTAPISITEWLVERGLLWGELAASGSLIIVPVIIFGLLVQRYLVNGLTMGAVKE